MLHESNELQTTIKRPVTVNGIDIYGTRYVTAVLEPAEENTGIVFVREDLPHSPLVHCSSKNARVSSRWTTLVDRGVRVEHTEHILAAMAGMGISNIIIRLNSPSVPVVDAYSCRDFVTAVVKAGLQRQKALRRCLTVKRPVLLKDCFYHAGKRYDKYLAALPADRLELIYILDYPDGSLPAQAAAYEITQQTFIEQLANARSFITEHEYQQVSRLIGQGMDSVLIFSAGSIQGLRWPNEPCRHKLVDLLGDLSTVGCDIKGRFIGFRSGHKLNVELIKTLSECEGEWND